MTTPKAMTPAAYLSSYATPPRACTICKATTREGKPYCPDHVADNPYVQSVLENMARLAAEDAEVLKCGVGAVDTGGPRARELVNYLRVHGPRTVRRLSLELQLDKSVVNDFVRALANDGQLVVGYSKRGSSIFVSVLAE